RRLAARASRSTIRDACARLFRRISKRLQAFHGMAEPTSGLALPPVIAIDGPAASGKGTIAWNVAQALGYRYLDSGSLYRLIALQALERGIDPTDADGLVALCPSLDISFRGGRAMLDGRDVADAL